MRVVIGFEGGSLDKLSVLGDSNVSTPESQDALLYYEQTRQGSVGQKFSVPCKGLIESYEVAWQLTNTEYALVRARSIGRQFDSNSEQRPWQKTK